ncbi:MAG TPA: LysR family transcriptional regulator [Burkholderiaceae bacterium]|nr:LysR family transcriptional regulator [Burkholderiaceae bacterium]
MELYQLRTFAAIAEEGHLTRAAERLHLSQPAVSGQIKALENEFEVRLFDRVSKGMELTTAGRELLAQASKVILAADALKQAARNLKGEITGTLRIGTVSDPHTNRVGELLSCALRRHPGLELELHHEMSGIALEDVRERKLDASFYFGDEPGPGFTALPLREVVYRVTAPAQWAQRVQAADWSEIAELPWVMTPDLSTHNRLVTKLLTDHGIDLPQHRAEADDERVIVDLVRSGVGVSLMREDVAFEGEAAGEVCIWDKARLTTTLWFVSLVERQDDPLIKALLELVRESWQEASASPSKRKTTGTQAAVSPA